MTTTVKNIIIGFGKAGKTLAGYLGSIGEDTILIEKSKEMYGGKISGHVWRYMY